MGTPNPGSGITLFLYGDVMSGRQSDMQRRTVLPTYACFSLMLL